MKRSNLKIIIKLDELENFILGLFGREIIFEEFQPDHGT